MALKKLFAEEGNKDLRIDFLNQLLPSYQQVAQLNFKSAENLSDIAIERKAIFDIYCESKSSFYNHVELNLYALVLCSE